MLYSDVLDMFTEKACYKQAFSVNILRLNLSDPDMHMFEHMVNEICVGYRGL
jgi:hypothetical protein